jgi:hypothetical protein
VTALFLADLLRALPVPPGDDVVLAECTDHYAAVYRLDFIEKYRPFLVLEIDGLRPERWPPPGDSFNPAPYAILVAPAVAPGVATLLDPGHKKPLGVVSLRLARFAEVFHDAYSGRWASLPPAGVQGREIWINSCASCHPGPGTTFGGTKSGMPFELPAAIAAADPSLFKRYVRNPQGVNPAAKMEPHPHYSDAQLDALIAFICAGAPSRPAG